MSLTTSDTADCLLHVGPGPSGGWVVEAADHSIPAATYATREQACREASTFLGHGWRMIVHPHPAADLDDVRRRLGRTATA